MNAEHVEKALKALGFDDYEISANNPLQPIRWGHDKPFPTVEQLQAALASKQKATKSDD